MPEQSLYDRIHDRFLPPTGGKPGTRYERLAAVVFAGLAQAGTVIHDLKLRGELSSELHQIDIIIDIDGQQHRVLIECKDFDLCGKPVGLSTIRDFYGVVADIQPNEAWVVSCNGFTKPARGFAKAFNIKLVVLREFRQSDWHGRIRAILLDIDFRSSTDLVVSKVDSPEPDAARALFELAMESMVKSGKEADGDAAKVPIEVSEGDGSTQPLAAFLESRVKPQLPTHGVPLGPQMHCIEFDDLTFRSGSLSAPISGITVSYTLTGIRTKKRIEAAGLPILLLKRPEGDIIVWDRDLLAYTIDATGRVSSKQQLSAESIIAG